jgi:hypothetical protein
MLIGGTGADLIVAEDGNDLMYDGRVSVAAPAGSDASTSFGDGSDQAMLALLSDWSTDSALSLLVTSLHDSSIDSLGGMTGTDTASPGPGDVGDWENTLP